MGLRCTMANGPLSNCILSKENMSAGGEVGRYSRLRMVAKWCSSQTWHCRPGFGTFLAKVWEGKKKSPGRRRVDQINTDVRQWTHACIHYQWSKVHTHTNSSTGTFFPPDAHLKTSTWTWLDLLRLPLPNDTCGSLGTKISWDENMLCGSYTRMGKAMKVINNGTLRGWSYTRVIKVH